MQNINGKQYRQDETGQWFVWTNEGTLLNCWGWLAVAAPKNDPAVAYADDIVGSYPEAETDLIIQVHRDGHASYATLCWDCNGTLRRISALEVMCNACGDIRRYLPDPVVMAEG